MEKVNSIEKTLSLNRNQARVVCQAVLYPFISGMGAPKEEWDMAMKKVFDLFKEFGFDKEVAYHDVFYSYYKPIFDRLEGTKQYWVTFGDGEQDYTEIFYAKDMEDARKRALEFKADEDRNDWVKDLDIKKIVECKVS